MGRFTRLMAAPLDVHHKAAIETLRKAVAVNPKFAPAKFHLGRLLIASGQNEEGSKIMAEAITLDPSLAPK